MPDMNDLANPMDLLKEYVQHMPNAKVTITDELGNEVYFLFSSLDMTYHNSWDTDAFGDQYATYSTSDRNPECVITCYYLGSKMNTERNEPYELRRETRTETTDKSVACRCRIESNDN